jgi:hypothetical protein
VLKPRDDRGGSGSIAVTVAGPERCVYPYTGREARWEVYR